MKKIDWMRYQNRIVLLLVTGILMRLGMEVVAYFNVLNFSFSYPLYFFISIVIAILFLRIFSIKNYILISVFAGLLTWFTDNLPGIFISREVEAIVYWFQIPILLIIADFLFTEWKANKVLKICIAVSILLFVMFELTQTLTHLNFERVIKRGEISM